MTLAAIENNHIKKRDKGAETVTMKNATTQQQSSIEKKTRRRSLHVEAIIQPTCPASLSDLRDEIKTFVASIGQSSLLYRSGPVELKSAPPLLKTNCVEISVVDLENDEDLDGNSDPSCQIDGSAPTVASSCVSQIEVHAYVLCNDEAEMEELEHADEEDLTVSAHTWPLLLVSTCVAPSYIKLFLKSHRLVKHSNFRTLRYMVFGIASSSLEM